MGPKVDEHLKLEAGGRTVEVVGPIGPWDRWIDSATFWVVIAQVQGAEIVVAIADPEDAYHPPDKWWDGDATVRDPNPGVRLNPGPARAWAVASFKTHGGNYLTYPWGVSTNLVDESISGPLPPYPVGWPGAAEVWGTGH